MLSIINCEIKSKLFKKSFGKNNIWFACELKIINGEKDKCSLSICQSSEENEYASAEDDVKASTSVCLNLKLFKGCALKSFKEERGKPGAVLMPRNRMTGHSVQLRTLIDSHILKLQKELDDLICQSRQRRPSDVEVDKMRQEGENVASSTSELATNASASMKKSSSMENINVEDDECWVENEVYESFDRVSFEVCIKETNSSKELNLSGNFVLNLTNECVELCRVNNSVLLQWKYRYIRRCGGSKSDFLFESGHRNSSGPGKFSFVVKAGEAAAQNLRQIMKERMSGGKQSSKHLEPLPVVVAAEDDDDNDSTYDTVSESASGRNLNKCLKSKGVNENLMDAVPSSTIMVPNPNDIYSELNPDTRLLKRVESRDLENISPQSVEVVPAVSIFSSEDSSHSLSNVKICPVLKSVDNDSSSKRLSPQSVDLNLQNTSSGSLMVAPAVLNCTEGNSIEHQVPKNICDKIENLQKPSKSNKKYTISKEEWV